MMSRITGYLAILTIAGGVAAKEGLDVGLVVLGILLGFACVLEADFG